MAKCEECKFPDDFDHLDSPKDSGVYTANNTAEKERTDKEVCQEAPQYTKEPDGDNEYLMLDLVIEEVVPQEETTPLHACEELVFGVQKQKNDESYMYMYWTESIEADDHGLVSKFVSGNKFHNISEPSYCGKMQPTPMLSYDPPMTESVKYEFHNFLADTAIPDKYSSHHNNTMPGGTAPYMYTQCHGHEYESLRATSKLISLDNFQDFGGLLIEKNGDSYEMIDLFHDSSGYQQDDDSQNNDTTDTSWDKSQ